MSAHNIPTEPSLLFLHAGRQFNAHEFWECHETLEMLWMRTEHPLKTFIQGLIQVAAGCHHIANNNVKGAISLLNQGVTKLKLVQHIEILHDWMNLNEFITEVEATMAEVQTLGSIRIQKFCPGKFPVWHSPEASGAQMSGEPDPDSEPN